MVPGVASTDGLIPSESEEWLNIPLDRGKAYSRFPQILRGCVLTKSNEWPLVAFFDNPKGTLFSGSSLTYGGSLRLMVVAKSGSRMGWIVTKIVLSSSGRIPHRILLTIFYQNRVKSALFLFLALAF